MVSSSLRLFAVFALCLAIAQASWFDGSIFGRSQHSPQPAALDKKQLGAALSSAIVGPSNVFVGTGGTTSTPTTTPPTSTPTTSTTPTTTTSTTSSSSSILSSSSTPTTTSPTSKTSATKTSPTTEAPATPSVIEVTSVVTVSDSTFTSVGSSTVSPKPTSGTQVQGNGSPSSGMSTKTKNTVIGVVVGIVGALLLAGLGLVAWRIWGRKKDNDDDDGLMGFRSGSGGHEKTPSSIGGSGAPNPFQSTLESYHGPPKQVNASSNF